MHLKYFRHLFTISLLWQSKIISFDSKYKRGFPKIFHLKFLREKILGVSATYHCRKLFLSIPNTKEDTFAPTELVIHTTINSILSESKWKNYFIKFVVPLTRVLIEVVEIDFKWYHPHEIECLQQYHLEVLNMLLLQW